MQFLIKNFLIKADSSSKRQIYNRYNRYKYQKDGDVMSNTLVAFLVGTVVGVVLGIFFFAVILAVRNNDDRGGRV